MQVIPVDLRKRGGVKGWHSRITRVVQGLASLFPVASPVEMSVQAGSTAPKLQSLTFRKPCVQDGAAVWQLVQDTGVLDLNSSYSYLMLSHYFNDTCMLVESHDHQVVGFVSAFLIPNRPSTLFVWQVAVAEAMRGHGIGTAMLQKVLLRPVCLSAHYLETTVTADNRASEAMFRRLAESLQTDLAIRTGFTEELFPRGGHDHERLISIGPFDTATLR